MLMQPNRLRRGVWLVLLAAALVGCASVTTRAQVTATSTPAAASPVPTNTATPAPTAIPLPALPWRQAPAAPGLNWAFAPSDGNTGYSCLAGTNGGTTTVWVTHDRGVHVTRTMLPAEPGGYQCDLALDANDAAVAVVRISGSFLASSFTAASDQGNAVGMPHSMPGPSEISDFLTVDGGQHWRLLPHNMTMELFTSVAGRIYAIIGTNPRFAGESTQRDQSFVVSADGMDSWRQLTMPVTYPTANRARDTMHSALSQAMRPRDGQLSSLPELFADPYSGELLYIDYDVTQISVVMKRSSDGGYSWVTLTTPATLQQFIFSLPGVPQPWTLCFSHDTGIWCSTDTGRSWQRRSFTDHLNFNSQDASEVVLEGIAGNGDLVAALPDRVLRLPAHATHWQVLGATPATVIGIFGPASANLLWAKVSSYNPPEAPAWYSLSYP